MKYASCAFSGHRSEKLPWGYNINDKRCIEFKKVLRAEIEKKIKDGVTTFLTGCQRGVDLMAGEIVVDIKRTNKQVKSICVIPFEGLANNWKGNLRNRYFSMIENSDEEILLATRYHKECYKARNRYLIQNAGHLIAVYDAQDKTSGTFQTINMGLMFNREITVINPITLEIERQN